MTKTVKNAETALSARERCECGKLLWKVRDGGLELKCNRCKRIHIIPLTGVSGEIDFCEHVKDNI